MTDNREEEYWAYVATRRGHLLRTATLLTAGDGHLAQDLVQQALVRRYLAWPRVRRKDGPDAYAYRILVNTMTEPPRVQWRLGSAGRSSVRPAM